MRKACVARLVLDQLRAPCKGEGGDVVHARADLSGLRLRPIASSAVLERIQFRPN